MASGIYLIKHKASGLLYVGQARDIKARWERHQKGDTNRYLKQIVKEEGPEALQFSVLEELSIDQLNSREEFWINSLNTLYPNGLNLTSGGKVPVVVSPEVRAILSTVQKERWKDPDRRQKQSELGRIRFSQPGWLQRTLHSPEARAKISASMLSRSAAMNLKRWGKEA